MERISDHDPEEVQRVMNAMMKKVKPDVTALETAYDDV